MLRGTLLAATAAATLLALTAAPAVADETVVVPGVALPDGTRISQFGCQDLYHADARGPVVRMGTDDAAPAGRRVLGLRTPAAGTAVGPVHLVDRVGATTVAGLSARADEGTTGVAWVWYVAPDLRPGETWAGRADLPSLGPGWQHVDTTTPTYTWTRYDAATGTVVEDGGAATIADFTTTHGDGPGYLLAGYGCDGHDVALDALTYGAAGTATTYDLEGVPVTTSISVSPPSHTGEVTVTGAGMGSSLQLEARPAGTDAWQPVGEPVRPAADGTVTATVLPEGPTEYRWHLPTNGYADEGWSELVRLDAPAPAGR